MAKKAINFTQMTEKAYSQIDLFKKSMVAIAEENIFFHQTIKKLEKKLEKIRENRKNDIANGLNSDEVIKKHPTVETERAIEREKLRHKAVIKPLNNELSSTYEFIPENMYATYERKILEGKRGAFLDNIQEFLSNLGIDGCSNSQIREMAERMSDNLGAGIANSKTISEDGVFHSALKERTLYKLFMSVFCDLYM